MPDLICPVCSGVLKLENHSFLCENRHCFDCAKSGYVNLLPPADPRKRRGDDRMMVQARTAFLDAGFYDPLSRAVSALAAENTPDAPQILDVGCGEGKYTADLLRSLRECGKAPQIVGVDISRQALMKAGKRTKEVTFCAASAARLPLASGQLDLIVDIFAPFMRDEFLRVLRRGGKLIFVYPLEKHLWELKKLVYDRPYENPLPDRSEAGLRIIREDRLCYPMLLHAQQLQDLFRMTPYYYKTGAEDQKKTERVQELSVSAEFGIIVYEKE